MNYVSHQELQWLPRDGRGGHWPDYRAVSQCSRGFLEIHLTPGGGRVWAGQGGWLRQETVEGTEEEARHPLQRMLRP